MEDDQQWYTEDEKLPAIGEKVLCRGILNGLFIGKLYRDDYGHYWWRDHKGTFRKHIKKWEYIT